MIAMSQALFALVALGLLAFAWRYGACEIPAPHHAEMLEGEGGAEAAPETAGPGVLRLLHVLYRSIAGLAVALAICVEMLAITVLPGAPGAAAAALGLASLAAGAPAAWLMRRAQVETGVPTPWLGAAGLAAAGVLGALLAALTLV